MLWAHQLQQQEVSGFERKPRYHQKRLSEESRKRSYVNITQSPNTPKGFNFIC
jgi:hypothetical protein